MKIMMNWKKLEELALIQNQVKEIRLEDKLGKRRIDEDIKNFLNQLLIQLSRLLKERLRLLNLKPKQLKENVKKQIIQLTKEETY